MSDADPPTGPHDTPGPTDPTTPWGQPPAPVPGPTSPYGQGWADDGGYLAQPTGPPTGPASGPPPPGYGAPAGGYGPPPPGYGAPAGGYGPPPPGYGAPAGGYGAPPGGGGYPPVPPGGAAPLGWVATPWGPRWRGPIGTPRSAGVTILLTIVTCGIWTCVWSYQTHEDLKRYRGDGLGGAIGLVLGLLVSVAVMFTAPMEIEQMYQEEGLESPVKTLDGLWFLLPVIGNFVWYLKVQRALNDFWVARGAVPA